MLFVEVFGKGHLFCMNFKKIIWVLFSPTYPRFLKNVFSSILRKTMLNLLSLTCFTSTSNFFKKNYKISIVGGGRENA